MNTTYRKSCKLGEFLNMLREAMAGWKGNRLMLATLFHLTQNRKRRG